MKDRLEKGEIGLAFHGSSQQIARFTSKKVGRGADSNSGLGLYLSHVPLNALDYAGSSNASGEGDTILVYVVAYPTGGLAHEMSPDEFFGIAEDDSLQPPSHFSHLRCDLLAKGFDRVECDTGEDAITVVLDPDRCEIAAVLDQEAVEKLECSGVDCLDFMALLEAIALHIPSPGKTRKSTAGTHEYS